MRTTVTCHISKYRVHVIPYKIIIVTMHKSGTYSTACNEGYSGDGMTCAGQNFPVEDGFLCLCFNFMLTSTPVGALL